MTFVMVAVVGGVLLHRGLTAAGLPQLAGTAVGLTAGSTVYLLLLRWAVWRWLAAAASVPALLAPLAPWSNRSAHGPIALMLLCVALLALSFRWAPIRSTSLAGALIGLVAAPLTGLWALAPVVAAPMASARDPHRGRLVSMASFAAAFCAGVVLAKAAGQAGLVVRFPPARPSPTSDPPWLYAWPGPVTMVLVACVSLAVAAALGMGRARASGIRSVCALTAAVPVLLALPTPPGVFEAPDRSLLVTGLTLALWPAAGALALTALLRGRRGRAADRPQSDRYDVDALSDFHSQYGDPHLAPVVVVIAAYNEAAGLPAVLAELPLTVCGLDTDVVVVDDGSSDGTKAAVRAQDRAYLVSPGVNRGQGAALRLGYRVAREHGGRYLITTDADGQYDPDDFPVVLAPLLTGEADFVTGSRRLGGQETRDRVRRLGVHVFAWMISALTGHWSTDTSFGLRAMRAEVTGSVTLNQPQYQSSELLIGVLSHGWRVREVPARMRLRSAGVSKKGTNLVYGLRYARVVLSTWWREGCPTPLTERAAALVVAPAKPVLTRPERA